MTGVGQRSAQGMEAQLLVEVRLYHDLKPKAPLWKVERSSFPLFAGVNFATS